jgi:hypothetical protein
MKAHIYDWCSVCQRYRRLNRVRIKEALEYQRAMYPWRDPFIQEWHVCDYCD